MTTELSNDHDKLKSLENVNRQLLENQSFLCDENRKLQQNASKLSKNLEELRKSTVDPDVLKSLTLEKNNLATLNERLKQKLETLTAKSSELNERETEKQRIEKRELIKSVEELEIILNRINSRPETFEIALPKDSTVKEMCKTLTKRLDEEQKRSDEAIETIRRLRNDDEKLILKDKIADLKQLITDLEVENSKLKFQGEQLEDDVERYKRDLSEAVEDAKTSKKEKYQLEYEIDKLKQIISNLENEKIKLKKDMIEELTEANRAKRVLTDTEIALQHISEAYENKRKEVARYQKQLDEANMIIRGFRDQFDANEPQY
ncbi:uncharacterized protein LOC132700435 [Cylas formicarius]|uniref:uncharacterized protein LOC132700435 n=1 Tax=Cylas formicarius TaxID=197179 RepID=UPI0029584168|nr:uncharacterized protein LOC132700435 [Cylas formicarius]